MKTSQRLIAAALFAGSGVVLVPAVHAQGSMTKDSGFYAAITIGANERKLSGESPTTYTEFKSGSQYGLAGGYRFGNFRVELEYFSFTNDTKTVASDITGPAAGAGHIDGTAYMFNGYYDITVPGWSVRPYVGVGFGQYSTTIKNLSNTILLAVPPAQGGPFVVQNSESDSPSAYQIKVGLNYAVTPALGLSLGYRYFEGSTLLFKGTTFGDLRPSGAKLNALDIGLFYNF